MFRQLLGGVSSGQESRCQGNREMLGKSGSQYYFTVWREAVIPRSQQLNLTLRGWKLSPLCRSHLPEVLEVGEEVASRLGTLRCENRLAVSFLGFCTPLPGHQGDQKSENASGHR